MAGPFHHLSAGGTCRLAEELEDLIEHMQTLAKNMIMNIVA